MSKKSFKFVYIPVDPHESIEERTLEFTEGVDELECFINYAKRHFGRTSKSVSQRNAQKLELLKKLPEGTKTDDASISRMLEEAADMQLVEPVPLMVNSKENEFVAVNMYVDDSGVLKDLPMNRRATEFAQMIGNMVEVRGDAFVSRIFDNEDDFHRLDFTQGELSSSAAWFKKANAQWRKKAHGPTLEDQFSTMTHNAKMASKVKELTPAENLKDEGNKAFKRGDYEAAASFYSQALEADGSLLAARNNRAMSFLKLQRYEETEVDCSAVLEATGGREIKALFRRGTARINLGKKAEAEADFKAILALEPKNQEAKDALANLTN